MGYWAECKRCAASIYMVQATPPGEYRSRWLPFDDESLELCHLDYCSASHQSQSQAANAQCPCCYRYISIPTTSMGTIWFCSLCKNHFEISQGVFNN